MSHSGSMSIRMMYVRFGTNLERDSRGGEIEIVYSLRASLDVRAHTVVVASGEGAQVGETMESDRVVGCRETYSARVLGDTAFSDIVGCLGANKETIATEHSVSSKCKTLHVKVRPMNKRQKEYDVLRTLKTSKTARE